MTVSTPVKIVALAGMALALGLGGLVMLTRSKPASGATTPPPAAVHRQPAPAIHAASAPAVVHKPVVHKKPAIHLLPQLPLALRHALLQRPVAVVVVYSSHNAADRDVLAEARAGARAAHSGFVAANVSVNAIAAAVATWSTAVQDPAVLVVKRPGTVTFTVSGPVDRDTVAQAVAAAR